jgi:hypothetical protein
MSMTTIESVKRSVTVHVDQEKAFQVFTARFGDWWPLATHHTAEAEAATAVIEPRAGGRWYERGVDGSETEWGVVTGWEPPSRLVLAWMLDPSFAYDPDPAHASEVEVRFVVEGPTTTRVELEHRNLEVYGDRAGELRAAIASDGGWGGILQEFARLVG